MIIDWTDFEPLGTEKLNSAPGVCVTAAGSISVYASVGPELELWYGSLLDGHVWSGLRLLDSEPIVSAPGVVARTPGSRDLFVRRPGYQLGHKAYDINIGWSPYEPVGPELFTNTTPAVCSRSTDRIDVFVRSATDHSLFILAFDGKRWLVATQLETDQLPAAPAATSRGSGRMDVVFQGSDNALWHKSFAANTWSASTRINSGITSSGPSICTASPTTLDVFVRRSDNAIWQTSFDGKWSGYEPIGTETVATAPAAVWANGKVHVFAAGQARGLLHKVGTPVPATSTQGDWRWCSKCQSLFFGGQQATSRCPVGDAHASQGQSHSGNYTLPFGVPATARRQRDWRWCDKCQGLFWGPGVNDSHCSAGGRHATANETGSYDYCLPHSLPISPRRQDDWRWCNRCQGLFWGPGVGSSHCAAGGAHTPPEQSGSSDYCLPHEASRTALV